MPHNGLRTRNQPQRGPVALVASLDGEARVALPNGGGPRPLALFERLPAGARIETVAGARLLLVYRSGGRIRLEPGSAVTVTDGDVTVTRGRVERLSPVPPLPAFDAPAGALRRPGVAAVRIRGSGIEELYPAEGARAIAEATVLAFTAEDAHGTYTVEIEDARGHVVFTAQTADAILPVPPGTLERGAEYVWRVAGRTAAGVALRGEADFSTLSADEAAWRADVRRATSAAYTAWLAEIDLALGLWREAQDGFRAAAAREGAADVIARRLEALAGILGAAQAR